MSASTGAAPWDFSHILDFHNNSLSSTPLATANATAAKEPANAVAHKTEVASEDDDHDDARVNNGVALGDFTRVWQSLGPTTETLRENSSHVYRPATPKDDSTSDSGDIPSKSADYTELKSLTKTQRKKQNRKARKKRGKDASTAELSDAAAGKPDGPVDNTTVEPVSSLAAWQTPATALPRQYEADLKAANQKSNMNGGKLAQLVDHKFRETCKQESANQGALDAPRTYESTQFAMHDSSGSPAVSLLAAAAEKAPLPASKPKNVLQRMADHFAQQEADKIQITPPTTDNEESTAQAVNALQRAMAPLQRGHRPYTPSSNTGLPRTKTAPQTPTKQKKQVIAQTQPVQKIQNFATPKPVKNLNLIPSTVAVQPKKAENAYPHFQHAPLSFRTTAKMQSSPQAVPGPKPKAPVAIAPLIQRSDEIRHWDLLTKLVNTFPLDVKHLISPMNLTSHNQDPQGIHVFVDASNIFIGFMNQLKRARGIHPLQHMPQAKLSFDALALLMERRRPVAKRVLAGSNPWLPAFDTAKNVGYEMNIMDKVHKARELTERQIYFEEYDARRFGKGSKAPSVHNALQKQTSPTARYSVLGNVGGSGTETSTPQYAPAKMIEQGVDEVLHLKISHSLLDYEEPSTIVLATGDAALAEYSDGFMAMAERALKKGWTVELVSWSKNISKAYLKSNWVNTWEGRFKIIYLDDFAEELLCM